MLVAHVGWVVGGGWGIESGSWVAMRNCGVFRMKQILNSLKLHANTIFIPYSTPDLSQPCTAPGQTFLNYPETPTHTSHKKTPQPSLYLNNIT